MTKMITERTPSSVDLTEAYRKAQIKILSSLSGTDPQTISINFTKTLQTVVTSLDTANAQAVEESVTVGARQSQRLFVSKLSSIFNGEAVSVKKLQALGVDIKNQSVAADILERKAQYAKDTAIYRQNFLELRGKLVGVSQSLQNQVNGTLKDLAGKAENTVASAIGELRDRLKTQGCFNVQYSNGASVGVDKYATMVCRSARTESANAENLRMAKAFGTDLVECVGNAVTCEVCAQYRGRVFSVSGKDKRYPPLRGGANSPLKNGYDLIHPNCRCEFRAYFEALHSDEENELKRKFSNRPFEGDKRTAEQARAYQEWQAIQRRAIDEQSRWNEMAAVLGKDNPYADIGALRRALRSDNDSSAYKKSHYAVRDYRQYEHWKHIIGEENMPKTLAEFQDLKYNNSNKFEYLKDFKDYRIDNPKATQADYQKVVRLRESGIKGEIHIPPLKLENIDSMEFDDHHINEERNHNVTKEEAISYIENAQVTIVKWDGRSVNFYSSQGVVFVKNGIIRTAFACRQFDENTMKIMEILGNE